MTDGHQETSTPPPIRLGRVNSLRSARKALVRVTQAVLDGTVNPKIGNAGIYGLSAVVKCLEVEVLERRLDELEARVGDDALSAKASSTRARFVGHA